MAKTRVFRKKIKKSKKRTFKKRRYLRNKYKGGTGEECPVCLEVKPLCEIKPCGHNICEDCFSKLRTKSCPLCRGNTDQLVCSGEIKYPVPPKPFVSLPQYLGDKWIFNNNDGYIYTGEGYPIINITELNQHLSSHNLRADLYRMGQNFVLLFSVRPNFRIRRN